MKNQTKFRFKTVIAISIFLSAFPLFARIEFSGDLTGVSTYVWRGIKANNGPALQSSAVLKYRSVSLGFWGSSIDFRDDLEVETDLYAEVALPTGDLATALGVTVYTLDFRTFNKTADAELELYGKAGYGPVKLAAYYVPEQNSTKPYQNSSNYWLELSGETNLAGADIFALLAFGTYSSRWMPDGDTKDTVALLVLTAGKTVTNQISVSWTYSLNLGSGFDNIFYFGGSYVL